MICQSWVNLPLGKDSVIYYTNLKSISLKISQGNDCVRTFTAQSIKTTNRPSNKKKKKESAGGESRQYKEGRPFHNPFPHLESVRQNNKITATLFMPPWFRERRESQSRLPMYCTLLPRPLLKTWSIFLFRSSCFDSFTKSESIAPLCPCELRTVPSPVFVMLF